MSATRPDAVDVGPVEPDDDEGLDVLARMRRDRVRAELEPASG